MRPGDRSSGTELQGQVVDEAPEGAGGTAVVEGKGHLLKKQLGRQTRPDGPAQAGTGRARPPPGGSARGCAVHQFRDLAAEFGAVRRTGRPARASVAVGRMKRTGLVIPEVDELQFSQ